MSQVDCEVGAPRVNYREAITQRTNFDYLHKKQSGNCMCAGVPLDSPLGGQSLCDLALIMPGLARSYMSNLTFQRMCICPRERLACRALF